MEVSRIIAEIDSQIARLQQARTLLQGLDSENPVARPTRGRPRKHPLVATPSGVTAKKKAGKRNLSPEARKRIADAQKRRWAERRKA